MTDILTKKQADALRAKIARFEAWRGGRRSYRTEEIPADVPRVTNDERSALEVFDFVTDPPTKYFLYIKEEPAAVSPRPLVGLATTWTGETLGTVQFGRSFRSNLGDVRVPVTIHAINGRVYCGTYFKSAGDYARVRLAKGGQYAAVQG